MRCPYCGGLNADQVKFCARCGRDITQSAASRPPYASNTPPQRPPYASSRQAPGQQPPFVPPRPPQPVAPRSQPTAPAQVQNVSATGRRGRRSYEEQNMLAPSSSVPVAESPVAFPPHTVQQLQDLEAEALAYTVLDESESYGRKKIVRIGYPGCAGWQQVATLYKALNAYRSTQFDSIIIQGVSPEKADRYNYTNGMIQFDQSVRLGSQILNRYQIETENGFSSDAVRIVLTEG